MSTEIIDQDTAQSMLRHAAHALAEATRKADEAMKDFRDTIVRVRPSGILSVDEMAKAIDRDRNYVDGVWSVHGDTQRGQQTRVKDESVSDVVKATVTASLVRADRAQRSAAEAAKTARAERDRAVALVYASKLVGPSDIAGEVDINRNHVLRIARRAGIPPVHRTTGSRNQYS